MVRYGDGYLMVGEDGGIFNFSSAAFAGSLGGRSLGPPHRLGRSPRLNLRAEAGPTTLSYG